VDDVADDNEDRGLLSLTTEIVASFVGNNPAAIGDLPTVIATVFGTLRSWRPPITVGISLGRWLVGIGGVTVRCSRGRRRPEIGEAHVVGLASQARAAVRASQVNRFIL
jgi:hypothetical protein